VQEAVDAPRIHHQWLPDTLRHEKYALASDLIVHLKQLGHRSGPPEDYSTEAHAIMVDQVGKMYLGAADPRYEGKAVGY